MGKKTGKIRRILNHVAKEALIRRQKAPPQTRWDQVDDTPSRQRKGEKRDANK